jgi:glycosyltransferase 2 family protein
VASVALARRPSAGLVQVGVSAAALAGIVWWGSRQHRPHVPLDARSLSELAGALGLYAIATVLRSERWHRILVRVGADRGRAESYRLTLVGYMGNNALPARAGDLMRVVLLGGARRVVLGTVVAERLLDVAALAAIFLVVVLARGLSFGPLPWIVGAGAVLLVVVALALWLAPRHRLLLAAREWSRPVVAVSRGLLGPFGVLLLLASIALWICEASVYLVVGSAVGIHLGLVGALYVMALANLSSVIPAAPGYVGTYDGAVLLALRSLGRPALGYLLVLRFVLFVPITVAGFAVFLARYARRRG